MLMYVIYSSVVGVPICRTRAWETCFSWSNRLEMIGLSRMVMQRAPVPSLLRGRSMVIQTTMKMMNRKNVSKKIHPNPNTRWRGKMPTHPSKGAALTCPRQLWAHPMLSWKVWASMCTWLQSKKPSCMRFSWLSISWIQTKTISLILRDQCVL